MHSLYRSNKRTPTQTPVPYAKRNKENSGFSKDEKLHFVNSINNKMKPSSPDKAPDIQYIRDNIQKVELHWLLQMKDVAENDCYTDHYCHQILHNLNRHLLFPAPIQSPPKSFYFDNEKKKFIQQVAEKAQPMIQSLATSAKANIEAIIANIDLAHNHWLNQAEEIAGNSGYTPEFCHEMLINLERHIAQEKACAAAIVTPTASTAAALPDYSPRERIDIVEKLAMGFRKTNELQQMLNRIRTKTATLSPALIHQAKLLADSPSKNDQRQNMLHQLDASLQSNTKTHTTNNVQFTNSANNNPIHHGTNNSNNNPEDDDYELQRRNCKEDQGNGRSDYGRKQTKNSWANETNEDIHIQVALPYAATLGKNFWGKITSKQYHATRDSSGNVNYVATSEEPKSYEYYLPWPPGGLPGGHVFYCCDKRMFNDGQDLQSVKQPQYISIGKMGKQHRRTTKTRALTESGAKDKIAASKACQASKRVAQLNWVQGVEEGVDNDNFGYCFTMSVTSDGLKANTFAGGGSGLKAGDRKKPLSTVIYLSEEQHWEQAALTLQAAAHAIEQKQGQIGTTHYTKDGMIIPVHIVNNIKQQMKAIYAPDVVQNMNLDDS